MESNAAGRENEQNFSNKTTQPKPPSQNRRDSQARMAEVRSTCGKERKLKLRCATHLGARSRPDGTAIGGSVRATVTMHDSENTGDLTRLSTITLLDRASSGSSQARETLYQRYLPRLQRWARGRLPGAARGLLDTDDVVQDVLANTLHRVDEFEPQHSGAFLAYMRRAVRNRLFEEVRRVSRRPPVVYRDWEEFLDTAPSQLEELVAKDRIERYEDALQRLKPSDQAAVIARVECGMSYQEIAKDLDKPSADAARMAVARALTRLAKEMAQVRVGRA